MRRKTTASARAEDYARKGWGTPEGLGAYTARFHGRCTRPIVMRELDKDAEGRGAQRTDTWVRCRECESCLRYRRAEWAYRIMREAEGRRSWFVTLTFKPGQMAMYEYIAEVRWQKTQYKQGQPHWRDLKASKKAIQILAELIVPVQKWLKRVRKRASTRAKERGELPPRLRYVLVYERGAENERPHAHLVISEAQGRVLEEELREEWKKEGFAQAKLLRHTDRGAWYAAKYLSKALDVRIRASLHYGAWRTANDGLKP